MLSFATAPTADGNGLIVKTGQKAQPNPHTIRVSIELGASSGLTDFLASKLEQAQSFQLEATTGMHMANLFAS